MHTAATGLIVGNDRYYIPALPLFRCEQEIKRSRFIVSISHAQDVESARDFVSRIRKEFPDATHNCWACAVGPPGDTAKVAFSDDGEPQGTAGRPMLHVLLHGRAGEIVAVVTRYFGGVKLGAGGLVRAYSGAVAAAAEELPLKEKIIPVRLRVVVAYSHVTQLKRLFERTEAAVELEKFTDHAEFIVSLPQEHAETLERDVSEFTSGQGRVKREDLEELNYI